MTKRNLVIAIAGILLLSCVTGWFLRRSPVSSDQDFAPGDFARIREVTRHRMWGTALPDLSLHTIKTLPSRLVQLGSSRIRQIDVLPAWRTVRVQVQSSSGLYCYLLEKYERAGRWDWRVVNEGVGPLVQVINLNGGAGYSELRVEGGFALLGGRLSSHPVDWLPPLPRRGGVAAGEGALPQGELTASVSNQLNLSYERHPFDPDFSPFANGLNEETGFSEGKFSAWVTNQNTLKLNR